MSEALPFQPLVADWFADTFGVASEPQRLGWPAIAGGDHTLILAPTGTGKTLAAFLWEVDQLIRRGLEGPLPNAVQILYVSPLKALSNDIQRNLEQPLAALRKRFEAAGHRFPEIRVAVRTGDTPASARARMLRKAPHILITTPESLHIMLTTIKGRGMFALVRSVIVDEIHAVAGTKRGAHLALTLERLEALSEHPPQRIGLSATQRPLDEIARYLGGCYARAEEEEPSFRPVTVVDCGAVKRMELSVVSPAGDLTNVERSVWPLIAELALEYIRGARTTLIFVNNRAQAERMAVRINSLAGEQVARPYHGSLARERRLALEQALKAGNLPALVTTSSLELGIDIGSVDLVLQLQSPKRVAAGLQRVGRSGHSLTATSKGVFVPTHRDDLVETAAVVAGMSSADVEATVVPQNALDVLAQVIVAMASVDDWRPAEILRLVRQSYPYHRLGRAPFGEVVEMLSGKYPADIAAELEPRLTWDRVEDRLSGSTASRMTAVISGGTIPDRGLYTVHLPDRTRLGELDEEFVHESRVGDVFQLGSATWRIAAIEHDRVIVTPAPGAPARMPFWHGEFSTRSVELGRRVGALRRQVAAAAPDDASLDAELARIYHCDEPSAASLREYIGEQRAVTGVVPDDRTILVEHFRDELGGVRIVVHSVFGGRVNAPWGMALAQRIRSTLGVDCQVEVSDDGILLRLPDLGMAAPIDLVARLGAEEARERVLAEVGTSPLFGARFRMNAARALLLPRGTPRRRMPLWLQRLKALDLLDAVRQYPSFPILVETYREVLRDTFDLGALETVLREIASGAIALRTIETRQASPFAAGLQFGFVMDWLYVDDTPRAERRAALLSLDRALLDDIIGAESPDNETLVALDAVLAERRGTAPGRRARTADELAQLIDRAGDITFAEAAERVAGPDERRAGDPLAELLASRRVIEVPIPGVEEGPEWRLILTEAYPRYAAAFGVETVAHVRAFEGLVESPAGEVVPESLLTPVIEARVARREVLARFLALAGPVTVSEVESRYGWPARWIESRLVEWQESGTLIGGRFRATTREREWCARKAWEAAKRRALAMLRRQIEAVDLPVFAAFLQSWQHLDPRTRLDGAIGVASVLRQMNGLARPAGSWERDYLPARVHRYEAAWLSQLAATGGLVWVGGATRRGSEQGSGEPLSLATIRFLTRGEEVLWLAGIATEEVSASARAIREQLERLGASFLPALESATGLAPVAAREAIRELAASGIVTNDTIEALREIVRTRPLPTRDRGERAQDPTRWLPQDYTPGTQRFVVWRRPTAARLPKWRRPDQGTPVAGWVGRWALVQPANPVVPDEESRAEAIARQWLDRYGVVTRDWWRRERPPVSWRAIYRELRRLEMRGEVRRGYFVRGLAGAQFALPAAVERLRAARSDESAPFIVMAASDPANPYSLPLEAPPPSLTRPRGGGALLVTKGGLVLVSAEGRGRRVMVAAGIDPADLTTAARALADHLARRDGSGARAPRDLQVETIDGVRAAASPHAAAFLGAGWRRGSSGLTYLVG